MAERVTDLRDIERRVVAHLVGEPEPGVPVPDGPRCWWPRTWLPPTPRPRPGLVVGAGDRAGRPDQPHRDHRPPARHPLRGRRGRLHDARGRHARCWSTAPPARSRSSPTPTRPSGGSAAAREAAGALARWTGPGAHRGRHRGQAARERRRRASAHRRRRRRSRASGCSAPSCASSTARTSRPSRSRPRSTSRCSRRSPEGRYVVVRTLDAGSDKPVAFATHEGEENPALGVRGLRLSFGNPGLLERQLDGIAPRPRAHRHRDLGDGADGRDRRRGRGLRRAGARPGLKAGVMVEVPERRAARAPDARGRRLPVDRHQRPDPVHDGRRPDGHRPGAPHRPVAAGGAAADRDHRRGRPAAPASPSGCAARPPPTRCWPPPWSAWGSRRCRWRWPPYARSARSWPPSRWTSASRRPRPRSAAADPMAARAAVRALLAR